MLFNRYNDASFSAPWSCSDWPRAPLLHSAFPTSSCRRGRRQRTRTKDRNKGRVWAQLIILKADVQLRSGKDHVTQRWLYSFMWLMLSGLIQSFTFKSWSSEYVCSCFDIFSLTFFDPTYFFQNVLRPDIFLEWLLFQYRCRCYLISGILFPFLTEINNKDSL